MTRHEEARRRSIEQDVLDYVLDRPAAKDTAEGVRHWWLRAAAGATAGEVQAVLAQLAAKGWLAVREMRSEAGEDVLVYELDASRKDEIRSCLAASRAEDSSVETGPCEMPGGPSRG